MLEKSQSDVSIKPNDACTCTVKNLILYGGQTKKSYYFDIPFNFFMKNYHLKIVLRNTCLKIVGHILRSETKNI